MEHDLITGREAARICGLSRSHIGRLAEAGEFPAPHRFSHRIFLWSLADVQAWADFRREQDANALPDDAEEDVAQKVETDNAEI